MRVRALTDHDIPAILAINLAGHPHVSLLSFDEIAELKTQGFLCWVCENIEGVIVGYILACQYPEDPATPEYCGDAYLALQNIIHSPFFYIDQIAVAASHRREGIANILYRQVDQWAAAHAFEVLTCEVNVQPPNPESAAFHQSLGFKALKTIAVSDGTVVSLMAKELTPYNKSAQTRLPLIWEQEGKNF